MKQLFYFILIIFTLSACTTTKTATKKEANVDVKVILLGGQSNMVGASNFGKADLSKNEHVEVWNPALSAWVVGEINDSFPKITGMNSGGNIAWFAAKEYQRRFGGKVRVVIDACGGRPIDDWLNDLGTIQCVVATNKITDNRFLSAMKQLQAAQVQQVDLIIFAQGESNNNKTGRSEINTFEEYRQAVQDLIARFAREPNIGSQTPFIMTELVDVTNGKGERSPQRHRNDVISQLGSEVVDNNPYTNTARAKVENGVYPPNNDLHHWNSRGLEVMGQRVIDALEEIYSEL